MNTEPHILSTGPQGDDPGKTSQIGEIEWRDLQRADIPRLASFAPLEWRMALDVVLREHFGRSYFRARVATVASRIVAVGQSIATGRTGWIGNIIVQADMRNRGLGSRMTEELIAVLRGQSCSSVLLVATAMGEPVYKKLGFRRTAAYVFLEVPRLSSPVTNAIRRVEPADVDHVMGIDATVTGETRKELLDSHLASGWVHVDRDRGIDGFFLPTLGSGLVLANGAPAGLDLLRFKHAHFSRSAVVPAANTAALQFLVEQGARETTRAPRMALGDEADWRPECVFARATGFCG